MNQNEKITEGLKQVIDSLCKRYDKEKQESFPKDYPSLYKKIEESKTTQKKVKAIYNAINDLKYYAKNLIPVSSKIEVKMANIIVNDLITGKLDKMLENIITDYEGRSCVRDKVNHIIMVFINFLKLENMYNCITKIKNAIIGALRFLNQQRVLLICYINEVEENTLIS